jgi:hypothetical protein
LTSAVQALTPVLLDTDLRAALDKVTRYLMQQRDWQEMITHSTLNGIFEGDRSC